MSARREELIEDVLDAALADRQAQMIRGDILQGVGFIEDHHLVIREQVGSRSPQCQVGEKESVVDDQDIGAKHAFACLKIKAFVVMITFSAQADSIVALNQVPETTSYWLNRQIGLAAIDGLFRPPPNLDQLVVRAGYGFPVESWPEPGQRGAVAG